MTAQTIDQSTQRTAAALLSRNSAYDADVLPLAFDGFTLTVGTAVDEGELVDRVRRLTRKDVRAVVLPVREIREGLKALYPAAAPRDLDSLAGQTLDEIFAAAISSYASDVHIEPSSGRTGRVRLDVDGVLQHDRTLEAGLFERVVSLVKVRSNMNTGESRLPQDGRLSVEYDGRSFDVRTSTVPIAGVEKIVLRFLQRFDLVPDLEQLGMGTELLARYQRGLRRPGSFCVVAGPTGSGKSTTSYASLQTIDLDHANVCSVEDPIEYRHRSRRSLIRQREIGRDVSSYHESLRGVLRADPDVILIGELRDPDVMSACLAASETGQLVFSTLHTSEAAETVQRIVGVFDGGRQEQARMQLAQSLQAIVSVRLVPDASGRGRRPACEIALNTSAVRSQLMSPEKSIQIRNTIETSRRDGMQTLEMDLSRMVNERLITHEAAVAASDYPEQIRVAAGIR